MIDNNTIHIIIIMARKCHFAGTGSSFLVGDPQEIETTWSDKALSSLHPTKKTASMLMDKTFTDRPSVFTLVLPAQ